MKTLGLFKDLSDFIAINTGETIFKQDQVTDFMYVLIEGQVSITRNGVELVTVESGNIIGEMAILENRPHFSSAVAKSNCKLIPIDRKRFQFLVEQTPNFAFDVMAMMSERLHQMNIKATS